MRFGRAFNGGVYRHRVVPEFWSRRAIWRVPVWGEAAAGRRGPCSGPGRRPGRGRRAPSLPTQAGSLRQTAGVTVNLIDGIRLVFGEAGLAAGMLRLRLVARYGAWNAFLMAGAAYLIVVIAVGLALPVINEVPGQFPAVVLWQFRIGRCR